jgi:hypothetical protein
MDGIYPIKGIITDLTPSEKLYLLAHLHHVATIWEDKEKAIAETLRRFDVLPYNNSADAFRHCYWSSLLARDIEPENAQEFTDAHEAFWNNPELEKAMDLQNNAVGIDIGRANPNATDDVLVGQCILALTDGRLKLVP